MKTIKNFFADSKIGIYIKYLHNIIEKVSNIISNSKINWYWLISFIGGFLFIILRHPMVIDETPYVEIGSNYLQVVYSDKPGFWKSLLIPDTDYMVWLGRIIAYVFSFLNPLYWVYAVKITTCLFSIFFISFINTRDARILIPLDIVRFLFSLIILLSINSTFYLLLNFYYIAILFIAIIIFIPKENYNPYKYFIYMVLSAVVIVSKPNFIAFIPVLIIMFVYFYYNKMYKSLLFLIPTFFTLILQIIYIYSRMKDGGSWAGNVLANREYDIILSGIFTYIFFYGYFIFKSINIITFSISIILMTSLLITLSYLVYKKKFSLYKFLVLVSLQFIILGFIASSYIITWWVNINGFAELNFHEMQRIRGAINSRLIFSFHLFILSILILIFSYKKYLNLLFIIAVCIIFYNSSMAPRGSSHGDDMYAWKLRYKLINNNDYAIPFHVSNLYSSVKKNNQLIATQNFQDAYNEGFKIRALVLELPNKTNYYVVGYDKEGNIVGKAQMYSYQNSKYKYFVFDGERKHIYTIKVLTDDNIEEKDYKISVLGGSK
jgi:hypothetical protein